MTLISEIQTLQKQGFKYKEIAEKLNVTNMQISSALHESDIDIDDLIAENYSNREISIITRKAVSTIQMLRRDAGDMRTAGEITRDKIRAVYKECGDINKTCQTTGFNYRTVVKHLL